MHTSKLLSFLDDVKGKCGLPRCFLPINFNDSSLQRHCTSQTRVLKSTLFHPFAAKKENHMNSMHLYLKLSVCFHRTRCLYQILPSSGHTRNFGISRLYWCKGMAKRSINEEVMGTQLTTFGNPPIPRAKSSFKEPVEMTGGRLA